MVFRLSLFLCPFLFPLHFFSFSSRDDDACLDKKEDRPRKGFSLVPFVFITVFIFFLKQRPAPT